MTPATFAEQLPERIEQALVRRLGPRESAGKARLPAPAADSHYRGPMSPQLSYGRHRGPAPWTARRAAVLVLLVPRSAGWHVPLAVRHETLTHHRGQIGLPGGQIEPGETSAEAALREFEEELGTRPACRLLGQLPACYVFASDFTVSPWIAVTDETPSWSPCPTEVERIVEMPFSMLFDPHAIGTMTINRGAISFQAPCYRLAEDCVWGATAVILSELAALVGDR